MLSPPALKITRVCSHSVTEITSCHSSCSPMLKHLTQLTMSVRNIAKVWNCLYYGYITQIPVVFSILCITRILETHYKCCKVGRSAHRWLFPHMRGQDFLFLFFKCNAESWGTLSSCSLAAVKPREWRCRQKEQVKCSTCHCWSTTLTQVACNWMCSQTLLKQLEILFELFSVWKKLSSTTTFKRNNTLKTEIEIMLILLYLLIARREMHMLLSTRTSIIETIFTDNTKTLK